MHNLEHKKLLQEMMKSETKEDADKTKQYFCNEYNDKFPKSVKCLNDDWEPLTAFFKFPAQHSQHIRTTNPIESMFATVKLRTNITKGAGSPKMAETMAFKLMIEAEKKWRKIRGSEEIAKLLSGVVYRNGKPVQNEKDQMAAAS
ncbi:transposase [Bacteriovoracaceae bacterium]|nr:transposase [Bacteriovoracaceae bacterium]